VTTLTTEQEDSFRGDAGDVAASPDVTSTQLQAFYDKALAFGKDEDTTYAITMVYYIRRLMGLAIKKIDIRGEVEAETRSQIFEHLKDTALPYWSGLAGMGGGGILTAGVLELNIDYEQEDFDNELAEDIP